MRKGFSCARLLLGLGVVIFGIVVTQAQEPPTNNKTQQSIPAASAQASPENVSVRRVRAVRVTGPINVDGRLDESAWTQAEAATNFRMEEPTEGTPTSERTEVRVLF